MYISKRLKELRTVSGFSQEKLAELLDVSRQTISSWENERSYPDVHNLIMPVSYTHLDVYKRQIQNDGRQAGQRDAEEALVSTCAVDPGSFIIADRDFF